MTHPDIQLATFFAIAAHTAVGQKRKYTGEPYWHHCRDVANRVWFHTGDPWATQAAWLHDTVEDTAITNEDIFDRFGPRVATLVAEVTDRSRPEDGNRAVRKAIDRNHLAMASPLGKTIKLADLISNTFSIVQHDPAFAKIYLAEKRELLPFLKEGNAALFEEATRLANQ